MEEKKQISVRLSTFILLIIILVLIAGIVYCILQNTELKNKQIQSEAELQNLQSKTQELQKTIDETKNTTINTATNTIENTEQNMITKSTTKQNNSEKQQYAGIYKNKRGETIELTLNNDGELYFDTIKIDLNRKNKNGAITIYSALEDSENPENEIDLNHYLYPVGIKDEISNTKDKHRILLAVGSEFSDNSVYYKVD